MGDLATLPISAALRESLLAAHLRSSDAVLSLSIQSLGDALGVSVDQAISYRREIVKAVGGQPPAASQPATLLGSGQTALELLSQKKAASAIPTFSSALDALLGGKGVPVGEITEICGVPGVGKTQLCMQLCLTVQTPCALGGLGGSAVYVDCEGALQPAAARLLRMAEALSSRLTRIVRKGKSKFAGEAHAELQAGVEGGEYAPPRLLSRIHVFRCTSLAAQAAVLPALPSFLAKQAAETPSAPVRLLVLDSAAAHFRYSHDTGESAALAAASSSAGAGASAGAGGGRDRDRDSSRDILAARSRQLQALSQTLHRLAAAHGLAVVVVNQMTTRIGLSSGGGSSGGSSSHGSGGSATTSGAGSGAGTTSNDAAGTLLDGTLVATLPPAITAALAAMESSSSSSGSSSGSSGAGAAEAISSSGSGGVLGSGGPLARLVPALGEVWAHAATHRLLLGYAHIGPGGSRCRAAQLAKSASRPPGVAPFVVTDEGIRDVPGASNVGIAAAAATAGAALQAAGAGVLAAAGVRTTATDDDDDGRRDGRDDDHADHADHAGATKLYPSEPAARAHAPDAPDAADAAAGGMGASVASVATTPASIPAPAQAHPALGRGLTPGPSAAPIAPPGSSGVAGYPASAPAAAGVPALLTAPRPYSGTGTSARPTSSWHGPSPGTGAGAGTGSGAGAVRPPGPITAPSPYSSSMPPPPPRARPFAAPGAHMPATVPRPYAAAGGAGFGPGPGPGQSRAAVPVAVTVTGPTAPSARPYSYPAHTQPQSHPQPQSQLPRMAGAGPAMLARPTSAATAAPRPMARPIPSAFPAAAPAGAVASASGSAVDQGQDQDHLGLNVDLHLDDDIDWAALDAAEDRTRQQLGIASLETAKRAAAAQAAGTGGGGAAAAAATATGDSSIGVGSKRRVPDPG